MSFSVMTFLRANEGSFDFNAGNFGFSTGSKLASREDVKLCYQKNNNICFENSMKSLSSFSMMVFRISKLMV